MNYHVASHNIHRLNSLIKRNTRLICNGDVANQQCGIRVVNMTQHNISTMRSNGTNTKVKDSNIIIISKNLFSEISTRQ